MASRKAYSVACINLFGRLWVELERVSMAEGDLAPRTRTEIIRLELLLLLDACRSKRWRLTHCALIPAIRIFWKTRTLYAYHAEPLPAGRLHHDPALEAVHHPRAQSLEA